MEKRIRDANDPIRVRDRGGKLERGQTKYLSLLMEDDTAEFTAVVNRRNYNEFAPALEEAKSGDYFLMWVQKPMDGKVLFVRKIRQISGDKRYDKVLDKASYKEHVNATKEKKDAPKPNPQQKLFADWDDSPRADYRKGYL